MLFFLCRDGHISFCIFAWIAFCIGRFLYYGYWNGRNSIILWLSTVTSSGFGIEVTDIGNSSRNIWGRTSFLYWCTIFGAYRKRRCALWWFIYSGVRRPYIGFGIWYTSGFWFPESFVERAWKCRYSSYRRVHYCRWQPVRHRRSFAEMAMGRCRELFCGRLLWH